MRELDAYLQNGDSPKWASFPHGLRLQSQTWRGIPWSHSISLHGPTGGEIAILLVTGGEPNDLDEEEAQQLSQLAQLPVATLYNIPNQPLFEDLNEDDLIAFTFIQYLATNEGDWPLLLPMVKSVVSAMDALEATYGLRKFIVTGLSKRGWTTWLAGAIGDPRIIGIAPMSIDHLDMPRQMEHQLATWGAYSEQIRAYTELDLPKQLDSTEGLHLNSIVDPYAYRDRIHCPTLIVTGTNDPYWQVNALSLYWDGLPEARWARVIPNVEHNLDKLEKNAVLAAFSRSVSEGQSIMMPTYAWRHECSPPLDCQDDFFLWVAHSQNHEFRDKTWSQTERNTAVNPNGFTAVFAEWRRDYKGIAYSITTPVEVLCPPEPLRQN